MGRPRKIGMDSFPHDTNGDERIEALRTAFGNDGYAFYFILCERIYRTETSELDLSSPLMIDFLARKVMVSKERFIAMLEAAIELGLFSSEDYEKCGLLTCSGIKRSYSRAVDKRNKWRDEKGVIHRKQRSPIVFQEFSEGFPPGKLPENENLPNVFKEVQDLKDLSSLSSLKDLKDFKGGPTQNTHARIQAPEPFAYEGNLDILAALNHYLVKVNGFLVFERIRSFQGQLSDDLILAAIKESGGRTDSYCLKVLENWNQKGWAQLTDHPKHQPTEGGDVVAIPWRRNQGQRFDKRNPTAAAFEEAGKRSKPGKQVYAPRE